jgi:hypothetical protein
MPLNDHYSTSAGHLWTTIAQEIDLHHFTTLKSDGYRPGDAFEDTTLKLGIENVKFSISLYSLSCSFFFS